MKRDISPLTTLESITLSATAVIVWPDFGYSAAVNIGAAVTLAFLMQTMLAWLKFRGRL